MNRKFLQIIKFLIGWPLSLIALIFVVKISIPNLKVLFENLENINIMFLFAGIFCFLFYFFLRSFLWKRIIDTDNKLKIKETSYIWGFSEFKRYVPGNIWSLLARGTSSIEKGYEKEKTLRALMLEIELIILSSIFLSIPFLNKIIGDYSLLIMIFSFAFLFIFIFGNKILNFKILKLVIPQENYFKNFEIFLISLLVFFIFGLGTFFSSLTITNLNVLNAFEYISLFVFSLLLGYLSIITPMGLGIREGVITYFLSKNIPLSLAGIIAIFSRVVLMFSELIFLTIVYFWNRKN